MASSQDAPFYEPLAPRISQGDLVKDVPWGVVETPLTVCRPTNAAKPAGHAKYDPPKTWPSNAFTGDRSEFVHASARIDLAIVLWHGCQLDKWLERSAVKSRKWFTAIAPVRPIDVDFHKPDQRQSVRDGAHLACFPLPALDDMQIRDSYVDLRYVWPVRLDELVPQRLVGLSTIARKDLQAHLFWFLTRLRLPESVNCPECRKDIALAELVVPEPATDDFEQQG